MADTKTLVEETVRSALVDLLGLSRDRVDGFDGDTPLFGALPELDSMAVATLLTELEDQLDITIDDDEVDLDMFESFGALVDFLVEKRGD
jgi:acyl carrier protein